MVAVGDDTRKERHYAVALDHLGQRLAELVFAASAAGYAELHRCAEHWPDRQLVFALEGAGSWGRAVPAPPAGGHTSGRGRATATTRTPRRQVRPHRRDRSDNASSPTRTSPPRAAAGFSGAAGAPDRPTPRRRRAHARAQPAPGAQRDRSDRAARAIGEGTGKQLERRILSMRARPDADIETRVVFAVCATSLPAHAHSPRRQRYQNSSPNSSARSIRRCSTNPGSGRSRRQAVRLRPTRFKTRSRLRALQRHRSDTGILRQDRPLPPQPRRRPPSQQRHPHIAIIRAKHQPETRAYLERRIREGKTKREASAPSSATSPASSSNASPRSR